MHKKKLLALFAIVFTCFFVSGRDSSAQQLQEISSQDIISAGKIFFGTTSGALAGAIEKAIKSYGLPNGYIVGGGGDASVIVGLRYGSGTLITRNAGQHKIYWQGPSVGFDFGGNGSKIMMLVYKLPSVDSIYRRFFGVKGAAYVVGGVGVTLLRSSSSDIYVVPVATGVGARLGFNIGYLKFTKQSTWNPF